MNTQDQTDTYNGRTNRATWAVNLWIENEEPSYRWSRRLAKDCYRDAEADGTFTRAEQAQSALAEALKEEIEDGNPLNDANNLYSDLLSSALESVNWREIARSYIEEVQEEIDREEQEDEDSEDESPADSGEES